MSFEDLYRRTCSEHKTQAYEPLLRKLHAAAIDADLDFLPLTKWDYFLSALTKCASSFRYVRLALHQTNQDLCIEENQAPVPYRKLKQDHQPTKMDAATSLKLCRCLSIVLSNSAQLITLELPGIRLTKHAVSHMSASIKNHGALQSLSLKDSLLGDSGLEELVFPLKNLSSLTALQLSGCALTDASGAALAAMIKAHQHRRCSDNWIGSLRSDAHGPAPVSPGLIYLDVSNNFLGDDTAKALAKALHEDPWLKGLDVARNRIRSQGAMFLQNMLCNNSALCYCNLSDNQGVETVHPDTITPWGGKWHRVHASSTACVFTRDAALNGGAAAGATAELWTHIGTKPPKPRPSQLDDVEEPELVVDADGSLSLIVPHEEEVSDTSELAGLSSPLKRQLLGLQQASLHPKTSHTSQGTSPHPKTSHTSQGTSPHPKTAHTSQGTSPHPRASLASRATSPHPRTMQTSQGTSPHHKPVHTSQGTSPHHRLPLSSQGTQASSNPGSRRGSRHNETGTQTRALLVSIGTSPQNNTGTQTRARASPRSPPPRSPKSLSPSASSSPTAARSAPGSLQRPGRRPTSASPRSRASADSARPRASSVPPKAHRPGPAKGKPRAAAEAPGPSRKPFVPRLSRKSQQLKGKADQPERRPLKSQDVDLADLLRYNTPPAPGSAIGPWGSEPSALEQHYYGTAALDLGNRDPLLDRNADGTPSPQPQPPLQPDIQEQQPQEQLQEHQHDQHQQHQQQLHQQHQQHQQLVHQQQQQQQLQQQLQQLQQQLQQLQQRQDVPQSQAYDPLSTSLTALPPTPPVAVPPIPLSDNVTMDESMLRRLQMQPLMPQVPPFVHTAPVAIPQASLPPHFNPSAFASAFPSYAAGNANLVPHGSPDRAVQSESYLYTAHTHSRQQYLPPNVDGAAFPTAQSKLPANKRKGPAKGKDKAECCPHDRSDSSPSGKHDLLLGRLEHSERENQRLHALLAGLVRERGGPGDPDGPPEPGLSPKDHDRLVALDTSSCAERNGGSLRSQGDHSEDGKSLKEEIKSLMAASGTATPHLLFTGDKQDRVLPLQVTDPVLQDPLFTLPEMEGQEDPVAVQEAHWEVQLQQQRELVEQLVQVQQMSLEAQRQQDAQLQAMKARALEEDGSKQQQSNAQVIGMLQTLIQGMAEGAADGPPKGGPLGMPEASPNIGKSTQLAASPFTSSIGARLQHKFGS